MKYAVRVYCGGNRESFLLSKGITMPNGDIEPGPVQLFDTPEEATAAGLASMCVQQMGWPSATEEYHGEPD
jgi:hypothetical protein